MLLKVSRYNQLRTEKISSKTIILAWNRLPKSADVQVASLGSIAGEVSALYGLKAQPTLVQRPAEQISGRRRKFFARSVACPSEFCFKRSHNGRSDHGPHSKCHHRRLVQGKLSSQSMAGGRQVTASFGERIDPFNGEGAFHSGVDIGSSYGARVFGSWRRHGYI